ncbi:MAG: CAP domain-containing protein [Pseudomonadota bacterium]
MKHVVAMIAICGLAACGGAGGSMSTSTSTSSSSAVQASLAAVDATSGQSFGNMLNAVRAENGVGALIFDDRLGTAAQVHADDMHSNSFMSHTGSDGSSVRDRVIAQNYTPTIVGENVAWGYRSEESVLRGWINSPDHQDNNTDSRFEEFGLARAGSGNNQYWALVLATEAP